MLKSVKSTSPVVKHQRKHTIVSTSGDFTNQHVQLEIRDTGNTSLAI